MYLLFVVVLVSIYIWLLDFGENVHRILRPKSPFLGAVIGSNSLYELKYPIIREQYPLFLYYFYRNAIMAVEGSSVFRPRFSPTISSEDVGRFLTEADFNSITSNKCTSNLFL